VPVLFDGFAEGRSVEAPIARLERMASPGPRREDPPELVISGPILHPELAWVIDSIEWGEALRDDRDGFRIRQAATVNLLEHGRADQRARLGTVRRRLPGPRRRPRLYTVKRGDTLSSIAARELGNASRWREIAALNGIRDPRSIKPGQQLVMP
jgi:nucleoid-associated protein YgaU